MTSEKKVANSKVRMSSAMPTSRNCCCNTAAIKPRALFGRGFHGEMKAHAIHRWISGLLQQLPGTIRIVIVVRHISVVRPTLRRKKAVGGPRKITQQILNHRRSVDGIRHRLPHAHILKNRIAQIERQVSQHRAGRMQDFQIGFVFESQHHVSRSGQ